MYFTQFPNLSHYNFNQVSVDGVGKILHCQKLVYFLEISILLPLW